MSEKACGTKLPLPTDIRKPRITVAIRETSLDRGGQWKNIGHIDIFVFFLRIIIALVSDDVYFITKVIQKKCLALKKIKFIPPLTNLGGDLSRLIIVPICYGTVHRICLTLTALSIWVYQNIRSTES